MRPCDPVLQRTSSEQAEPFASLTRALSECFPGWPPYGGEEEPERWQPVARFPFREA